MDDTGIRLAVVPPKGDPYERTLRETRIVIGRSSKATLHLPDGAMSREHARLSLEPSGWTVTDLGSRNGTLLNGDRLEAATVLSPGDELELGGTTITVVALSTKPGVEERGFSETAAGKTVFRPASELLPKADRAAPGADLDTLRRYAGRLHVLNEVHRALGRSLTLKELLELILDRAFDHLKPEEGAIFLKEKTGDGYACAASRYRHGRPPVFSRHLVHEVAEKGLAALVLDTRQDDRFAGAESLVGAGVRSLVAAPLMDEGAPLGMIVLGSRLTVRAFTEEDMELLVSLASVAALRLCNVALAEEAAERRRLEDEVALARRIQVALLPDHLPAIPGYALHGGNLPSRWVSGDFYVVLPRNEGQECVLMVADVSGKGIAAALLTASLEALAAAPIEAGRSPAEVYNRISPLLYRRTPPEKYATSFLATLDVATGRLTYANAGHPPALVARADGTLSWLKGTGIPLGLLPEFFYEECQEVLNPGDLLVVYTDGILEAMRPDDEEYGQARLAAVCAKARTEGPEAVARALEKDLDAFVGGVPYMDDRTVVLAQRLG